MENFATQPFDMEELDFDSKVAAIDLRESMEKSKEFWGETQFDTSIISATLLKCPPNGCESNVQIAAELAQEAWESLTQTDYDEIVRINKDLLTNGEIAADNLFPQINKILKRIREDVDLKIEMNKIDKDYRQAIILVANQLLFIFDENAPPSIAEDEVEITQQEQRETQEVKEEIHSKQEEGTPSTSKSRPRHLERDVKERIKNLLERARNEGLGEIKIPKGITVNESTKLHIVERQIKGRLRLKHIIESIGRKSCSVPSSCEMRNASNRCRKKKFEKDLGNRVGKLMKKKEQSGNDEHLQELPEKDVVNLVEAEDLQKNSSVGIEDTGDAEIKSKSPNNESENNLLPEFSHESNEISNNQLNLNFLENQENFASMDDLKSFSVDIIYDNKDMCDCIESNIEENLRLKYILVQNQSGESSASLAKITTEESKSLNLSEDKSFSKNLNRLRHDLSLGDFRQISNQQVLDELKMGDVVVGGGKEIENDLQNEMISMGNLIKKEEEDLEDDMGRMRNLVELCVQEVEQIASGLSGVDDYMEGGEMKNLIDKDLSITKISLSENQMKEEMEICDNSDEKFLVITPDIINNTSGDCGDVKCMNNRNLMVMEKSQNMSLIVRDCLSDIHAKTTYLFYPPPVTPTVGFCNIINSDMNNNDESIVEGMDINKRDVEQNNLKIYNPIICEDDLTEISNKSLIEINRIQEKDQNESTSLTFLSDKTMDSTNKLLTEQKNNDTMEKYLPDVFRKKIMVKKMREMTNNTEEEKLKIIKDRMNATKISEEFVGGNSLDETVSVKIDSTNQAFDVSTFDVDDVSEIVSEKSDDEVEIQEGEHEEDEGIKVDVEKSIETGTEREETEDEETTEEEEEEGETSGTVGATDEDEDEEEEEEEEEDDDEEEDEDTEDISSSVEIIGRSTSAQSENENFVQNEKDIMEIMRETEELSKTSVNQSSSSGGDKSLLYITILVGLFTATCFSDYGREFFSNVVITAVKSNAVNCLDRAIRIMSSLKSKLEH